MTASWHLYTQSDILKYRPLAEPKYEDFWSEDLFVPTSHLAWDRTIVKGHEYEVALLLKKALFPLKAGKLTITPLEAEATTMQTAFMAGASDARKSKAITVEVMPLPVEGRPAAFEPSNVGHYELSSSVDRTAVKAGEAVTWKVTVRGTGNIRNVRLPKLEKLEGFRALRADDEGDRSSPATRSTGRRSTRICCCRRRAARCRCRRSSSPISIRRRRSTRWRSRRRWR